MSKHRADGPANEGPADPRKVPMDRDSGVVVHTAGMSIRHVCELHPPRIRQRCAWCGAMLIDQGIELPVNEGFIAELMARAVTVEVFGVGDLVAIDADMNITRVGDGSHVTQMTQRPYVCIEIDPEVTA